MIDTDALVYQYAAGLALLINVLATALVIATTDAAGHLGSSVPVGAVCNLAGYVVVIGALRDRPGSGRTRRDESRTRPTPDGR